jgi:flagellar biogenesis protein FliO
MQFLTALFGGTENTILNAVFALGIVLVLILFGLWVMKFFLAASANVGRGRSRRLTVVESVQIDARHKVTILRRDNVEHVIMTGGAQDVVLETGIAVEKVGIRRPAPAQPAAAQTQAAPAAEDARPQLAATSRTPMERLRDAGRPAAQRKAPQLRNTSLLRGPGRSETPVIPMNGYNSDALAADSAKTGPVTETNGQAKLGAATSSRFIADALKAEGK